MLIRLQFGWLERIRRMPRAKLINMSNPHQIRCEVGLGIPNSRLAHVQFGFLCVTIDSHGKLVTNTK